MPEESEILHLKNLIEGEDRTNIKDIYIHR